MNFLSNGILNFLRNGALLLCALALAFPVRAEKTVRFNFQTSEARAMDVMPSTYVRPLVANVVVDTSTGRIRDSWVLSLEDFKSRQYSDDPNATLQNLKAFALFKSSEKHNCDLIVAPIFDIKITESGAEINLIGYPANFANWSTGAKADMDWIEFEKQQMRDKGKIENDKPKEK